MTLRSLHSKKMLVLRKKHAEKIKFFEQSIKSEQTKRVYRCCLRNYMEHLGANFDVLLEGEDPDTKKIEQSIFDFIILLKEEKSYLAIHNYVSAVIAFYKINDIMLNVNKISRFMPQHRKSNKDRAYQHDEIGKLLSVSHERMRAIILLLASSGMRIGAIPALRLRNLEELHIGIEDSKIYKITVYENDKEEHFTYCTPECAKAIDEYLQMRSRYGEKLTKESFLIREMFDMRDPFAISRPARKMSFQTLENKIIELGIRSGLRTRTVLDKEKEFQEGSYRKDVPIAHGFRKFFTTQLVNVKVNPEIREMLLGQKIGLASAYYKPTNDDFLAEYQKAVNNLTINEKYKLKMQVKKLVIENSQLQELAKDVAILNRKYLRK